MIDFKALAAPFPPEQISWRIGSVTAGGDRGMALAYLDARDVMDRLDAVCGPAGWQCKYSHAGQKTICDIGIKCGVLDKNDPLNDEPEWIWKADGAGDSDIEAEKGALSDSFKRAAVRWGIGRYLYHLPSPWVEIEKRGRTSIIKDSEYAKLEAILAKASKGLPQDKAAPPAPDADALAGATRWTGEVIGFLNTVTTDPDLIAWNKKNAPALKKLKGVSEDLYEKVMVAVGQAQDRVRSHL